MNKYGSIVRTVTARNILTGTISPDLTVSIAAGTYLQSFYSYKLDNHLQSNFLIHSGGLFSNYGKGLVLQNPQPRMTLSLQTMALNGVSSLSGTIEQNDNIITGTLTHFLTELSVGDIVLVSGTSGRYQFVQSIISDTSMIVSDFLTIPSNSGITKIAHTTALIYGTIADMHMLNTSYCLDRFVPIALSGITSILCAKLVVPTGGVTYLTTSINQGYAGQPVFMDVMADIEITPS
jgi:hypothetical protein